MVECKVPKEKNLSGVVHLKLEAPNLDVDRAKEASRQLAHTYVSDPKLVSWYEKEKNKFFPEGEVCGDRPDWLDYARSKGGNLTIDVNHEEYVFVYRGVQRFP